VPLSRSHNRTVRSSEAETARRPSGITANAGIQSLWPSAIAVTGSRWPSQAEELRAALQIPQAHCPIVGDGYDGAPVRQRRRSPDRALVTFEAA
jgi:hypothetical protein